MRRGRVRVTHGHGGTSAVRRAGRFRRVSSRPDNAQDSLAGGLEFFVFLRERNTGSLGSGFFGLSVRTTCHTDGGT